MAALRRAMKKGRESPLGVERHRRAAGTPAEVETRPALLKTIKKIPADPCATAQHVHPLSQDESAPGTIVTQSIRRADQNKRRPVKGMFAFTNLTQFRQRPSPLPE
jgi:hypothetical protein